MRQLVFVESGCLVDAWSMATRLVRSLAPASDAVRALDAEAARGTDPVAVAQALWGLLAGTHYRRISELAWASSCVERADPLGRAAARLVRDHRRAGDTVVVVSDLVPAFAQPLAEHLGVHRVVCGPAPVDPDGRMAGGFPGILLGPAAGMAAELVAGQESVAPARCVAYGRDPRDGDLLRAVGHGVRIDYGGALHSLHRVATPVTVPMLRIMPDPGRGEPARHPTTRPAVRVRPAG